MRQFEFGTIQRASVYKSIPTGVCGVLGPVRPAQYPQEVTRETLEDESIDKPTESIEEVGQSNEGLPYRVIPVILKKYPL